MASLAINNDTVNVFALSINKSDGWHFRLSYAGSKKTPASISTFLKVAYVLKRKKPAISVKSS